MTPEEAKTLKPGDRVLWHSETESHINKVGGTVKKQMESGIGVVIDWDDEYKDCAIDHRGMTDVSREVAI